VISVIGKRTFDLVPDVVTVSTVQMPLLGRPVPMKSDPSLHRDPDIVVNRSTTDIVVEGTAYAHDGSAEFEVSVMVGDFRRRVRVVGDRRCTVSPDGRILVSEPTLRERTPLAWASAYGGVDRSALKAVGDRLEATMKRLRWNYAAEYGAFAYPRNRIGAGYCISHTRQAIEECRLASVVDPHESSRATTIVEEPACWPLAPIPASLGWMPMDFFPRSSWLGLPPPVWDRQKLSAESFVEVRAGLLDVEAVREPASWGTSFSTRANQSAAPGMQTASVAADAEILLENLHPHTARFRTRLPGRVPRMVLQLPGAEPVDLAPTIRTVHVEPDDGRLSLVWVGEHVVRRPHAVAMAKEAQHAVIW
jgi:hypothetical protein